MNILQVVSSFPPAYSYGGPVKAVYDLSKGLVQKGHNVSVYTTDVLDRHSRLKCDNPTYMDGIEVYRFRNLDNIIADTAFDCAPKMASILKKKMSNFDLVHLHEYRSFQAMLVHHYSKKKDIPFILQPRGSLSRFGKTSEKKIFDDLFGHRIVSDSSLLIASSNMELMQFSTVFPWIKIKEILMIPNYIDISQFISLPVFGSFREKYRIGQDAKLVLYLSRIHKLKGADILIKSFRKLKNIMTDVKLVVAGPDEGFLSELKLLVVALGLSDDVLFTGPLFGIEKISALVDADVFVLPSHYESFGNVVVEAMASGTPVILSDQCGVKDWVSQVSLPVQLNDEVLMHAMLQVLKDDTLKEKLSKDGREFALNGFNLDNIIEKFVNSYRSLVDD